MPRYSYAKILTRKEVVPKEEHGLDTATDEGKKNRIQGGCYRRGLFALILCSPTLIHSMNPKWFVVDYVFEREHHEQFTYVKSEYDLVR